MVSLPPSTELPSLTEIHGQGKKLGSLRSPFSHPGGKDPCQVLITLLTTHPLIKSGTRSGVVASTAFSQLQLLEWSGSQSWEGNCFLAELAIEAIFLSTLQWLHTRNATERARQATHTGLKCPGLLSFHPQCPLQPGPVSPSTARSPITRSPPLTLDAGVPLPCSMPPPDHERGGEWACAEGSILQCSRTFGIR